MHLTFVNRILEKLEKIEAFWIKQTVEGVRREESTFLGYIFLSVVFEAV